MALCDKISINGEYTFDCYEITKTNNIFEVALATGEYSYVIEALDSINYIDIISADGFATSRFSDYDGYSSVSLLTDTYIDDEGNYTNAIRVVFKKTSIEEKVAQLDQKINGIVDEEGMTLDEYKEYKISLLGEQCRELIHNGLDVETSKGTMHFTYNYDDQFNIKTLFDSAILVNMDVPYHSSGNVCTIFTWQDAISIYVALESNLLYHTTYCNALNTNIREDLTTKEAVAAVTYGQDIPDSRKEDMNAALQVGQNLMDAILIKCGLKEGEADAETETTV